MAEYNESAIVVGASRGIGAELVRQLLARGTRVAAVARDVTTIGPNAEADASQLLRVAADVTNEKSLLEAADAIGTWSGGAIDVLIHNAGILTGYAPADPAAADADDLATTLEVNTVGAMRSVKAFIPLLRAAAATSRPATSQWPRVAFLSSIMGSIERATGRRAKSYSVSKAALNMYGRLLAHDLHAESIGVLLLHPGWVQTDMGGAGADIDVATSASGLIERIASWTPQSPLYQDYRGQSLPW